MDAENSESAYHVRERKKSNLAFAFFCMEKDRARDMETFYAFCRLMDDIADEEVRPKDERRKILGDWKREIDAAYDSDAPISPLGEEMRSLVRRRNIPRQYVLDIIDGVLRDTYDDPFETFEDVRKYCYGVASAVGLVSIYIFGFKNERTKEFAESLGYALQFTNILRDVLDDIASHGRVYIPASEMEAFGVSRADLLERPHADNCRRLFAFMYFRAKHFFNKSRRLLQAEDKRALAPALVMWAIYEEILETIKKRGFLLARETLKISKPRKIALALGAIRRSKQPEPADKKCGRAIVAGAGVAGIGAALRLALEGFDVSLYEAKSHIGGRCAALDWNGSRLDNASHAAMGCYRNFFGILDTLSTSDFFAPTKSMEFLFGGGKKTLVEFPDKRAGFLKRTLACLAYGKLDGMRKNLPLFVKLKLGLANARDGETALAYLERMKIGAEGIANFWEPFCVSALNTPLAETDATLMLDTAKKSVLGGGINGVLYLPQKPIADALAPAALYIKGVGGNVFTNETVEKLHSDGKRIAGISTNKCDFAACDVFVSALGFKTLAKLLPENSAVKRRLSDIAETDITNIYFETNRELLDGEYACLIGSPLHWIFRKPSNGGHVYGITISASSVMPTKAAAETLLKTELKKFFGEVEISAVLPSTFVGATISADTKSERARPKASDFSDFENMRVCGDWVQSGLPCTMESAAKSSQDFEI